MASCASTCCRSGQASGGRRFDRRRILNAILYVVRTGCQWRQLPHDFPKWKTVYTVFWRWRRAGVWQRVHDALAREGSPVGRQEADAHGGDHRQSVDSHGRRGRRTRLRRGQEDHRPQAASGRRHAGIGAGGRRAWSLLARSRWSLLCADAVEINRFVA